MQPLPKRRPRRLRECRPCTAIDFVNVRSGPGTTFSMLVVAPPGASGEVSWQERRRRLVAGEDLHRICADGFGWVSADWVTPKARRTSRWSNRRQPLRLCSRPRRPPVQPAACWSRKTLPMALSIRIGTPFDTTWVIQNTGTADLGHA